MLTYTKLIKKYSKDYFDIPTEKTIRLALLLIKSIEKGEFEYDTHQTDTILTALKCAINEMDI